MFAEEGFIVRVGVIELRYGIVALVDNTDARVTLILRRFGSMYSDSH